MVSEKNTNASVSLIIVCVIGTKTSKEVGLQNRSREIVLRAVPDAHASLNLDNLDFKHIGSNRITMLIASFFHHAKLAL